MKKIVLLVFCLLFLVACGKVEEVKQKNEKKDSLILEKIDKSKDFVYFNSYKEVKLGANLYKYEYPVINLNSGEVENLNLELKNFVVTSYKDAGIYNGILNSGNVVNHSYYINDTYISVIRSYYYYIDGMVGEYCDDVYVVSLKNGKILNNNQILKSLDLTEDDVLELLKNKLNTDDISFSLKNVKDNGYSLYITNENKLGIIFYEVTDEEEYRREYVLN
jgi:hypothetical protein